MFRAMDLRGRQGISIVEVLVVIAVIGLLAAVILPAVQSSRGRARSLQCKNHLRQIGLVAHSYVDSHGYYPTNPVNSSFFIEMLPGLDASAMAETLKKWQQPESYSVPVMLCPDDEYAQPNQNAGGECSYFLNAGTTFQIKPPTNGFYDTVKNTTPSQIRDGASQVVMLSERLVRNLLRNASAAEMEKDPARYFWWSDTDHRRRGEEQLAVENCKHHMTTPLPQFFGSNHIALNVSFEYNHLLPPNHRGCYNGPEGFGLLLLTMLVPASSRHRGGVHSLFVDGSVHFVSNSIDEAVWQALGTRADQEPISLDF